MSDEPMKVYVKLYATLTKYAGGGVMHEAMSVELPEGSAVRDLYGRLGIPEDEIKTTFVNASIRPSDHELREGDEVGIFPPVGGG